MTTEPCSLVGLVLLQLVESTCMWAGDEWGFTGIFDRDNGGGFLTEHFPGAAKAVWHFDGIFASSRHIPGTPCRPCGSAHRFVHDS